MMTKVGVMSDDSSVVTHRAGDAAHAARLLREAQMLGAARHPGVVELVGLETDADRPELVTTRVEGGRLSDAPPLAVEEVAGVVAALADTVADLHELGLVHGAITADHVMLDLDGRPVLGAFGWGARAGEIPVAEPDLPEGFADPARSPGSPLSPANDVFALGALLGALLTGAHRDSSGDRRRNLGRRAVTDALRAVADRATASNPQARPGARALSAAVGHAAPGARLPRHHHPGASHPSDRHPNDSPGAAAVSFPDLRRGNAVVRRPRGGAASLRDTVVGWSRRRLVVAGAGIGFTVVALGLALRLGHGRQTPSPAPDGRPDAVAARAGAPGPEPESPTSVVARPGCPPVTSVLAADVDGDGCPDALRYDDGVVVAGDVRWAVGAPGDQPAVGDWTCRGVGTLALLRPSTGEVFVFDAWATVDHDVVGGVRTRVEGATALRTVGGDGRSCPQLVVERRSGPPETVPLPGGGE
jgi:hypothetical protein